MNYILLVLSVAVGVLVNGIMRNDYSKKDIKSRSDLYLFNIATSVFSVLTLGAIAGVSGGLSAPSLYTVVIGIAYGIASALCAVYILMALETGPLSYTTVIISCAMVIPALSGLWFGEQVSFWQYAGIVVMVLSFVLAVDIKGNSNNGTSFKWFIYSLLAFIFNGSVGVMQKIHQNSSHRQELGMFLVIAFVASALFSLGMMLYFQKVKKAPVTLLQKGKTKRFWWFGIVIGIGWALCNQINMYLSGVMDSIIFFPAANGGSMIITAAVGLVFFKEKLSKKQGVGLLLGVAAMFLLCNIL